MIHDIAYKLVVEEEIVIVASPSFAKKYKIGKSEKDYLQLPHLLCERLSPDKIFSCLENKTSIIARFNDMATTRAACIQGIGWALLPKYSVQEEINNGLLVQIERQTFGKSRYGIWWLRKVLSKTLLRKTLLLATAPESVKKTQSKNVVIYFFEHHLKSCWSRTVQSLAHLCSKYAQMQIIESGHESTIYRAKYCPSGIGFCSSF